MPIFLLFVILFAMWIRYEIKKNSQIESDNKTSFIERERQANFARRADIANLDYVSVPLASLPFSDSYDEVKSSYKLSSDIDAGIKSEILTCEKNVIALSQKKILNLNGLSNTDILMLLPANPI